jgi:hypothetical protein
MRGWRDRMKLALPTSLHRLAFQAAGALLMLAGAGLLATTVHSVATFRALAARHGGEVIELGADAGPQPGQQGYMVRLAGTPKVVEAPRDPEFGLRVDTPVLLRHVDMFQWREVRIGSTVHYEQDWVDRPLDSSRFEQPAGHANPGSFALTGKQFDAALVQLDGFTLASPLVHALPGVEPASPDPKALPANLAASFSLYQNALVTSASPGNPRLGDLRVSWEKVPLQPITVLARIDGDRLEAATGSSDGKGYEVRLGDVSLLDMFPELPLPPGFVLGRQIIAVLLAALGALVILSGTAGRRADPLLALALGTLVVSAVASVMMLGNDSFATGMWLALTALGIGVALWRARRYRRLE